MTWILALTGVGVVLWGVGVWEVLRAEDEPQPHRRITMMRHGDRLLVGMESRGETWMWVLDLEGVGLMGLWLCRQAGQHKLSLTLEDAVAITGAAERYMAAERSVVDQSKST